MLKKNFFTLCTILLMAACGPQPEPEDCSDNIDNDLDGEIDCQDADCSSVSNCDPGPVCGDGVIEDTEECDGDNLNGQTCADLGFSLGELSCDANCQLDSLDCTNPSCGNGIEEEGEECDDGNNSNNDGCTNECTPSICGDGFLQQGVEACDDGNTNNTDACTNECTLSVCGDGFIQQGVETCDDGNTDDDDGCSSACALESCGDGAVQPSEACDDGNSEDNDGCSALCEVEFCGDGVVQNDEECDDANTLPNDGCDAQCKPEVCGDGVLQIGEGCDDGNLADEDGCNAQCQIESCGDGVVQAPETCDDQNLDNNDTCLNTCQLAACGDGVILSGLEACDDGNDLDNDGCSALCEVEFCGDGVVQNDEECDDTNNVNDDGCDAQCNDEFCGDGIINVVESCEDGNLINGDGCDSNCQFESACGPNETEIIVSNNSPLAILDNQTVQSTINIPATGTVKRARVGIGQLLHVNPQQLTIRLNSPQDTSRTITSGNGNFADHIIAALFADNSLRGIVNAQGQITGLMAPQQTISTTVGADFAGQAAQGDWQLSIIDNTNGTTGTLNDWTMLLCIDPSNAVCGDGVVSGAEECDDNNTNRNDGCNSLCQIERCGDGVEQTNEDCDDGNNVDNDGCESNCSLTCGSEIPNSTRAVIDPASGACLVLVNQSTVWQNAESICEENGGHLAVIEDIAVDNLVKSIVPDNFFVWIGYTDLSQEANSTAANFRKVTGDIIGAGFHNFRTGEPNQSGNEDCVEFRTLRQWNDQPCTSNNPFVCELEVNSCGDGVLQAVNGEQCDDRNNIDGDGCDINCAIEPGFICTSTSPAIGLSTSCSPTVCGDGIGEGEEECDDGNQSNNDDCTNDCLLPSCGDGFIQQGVEACDDGNSINTDACTNECTLPVCGDGFIQQGVETCDDGNTDDDDGCNALCQPEFCGDGVLQSSEACEDGNTVTGDGCSSLCAVEAECNVASIPGATNAVIDAQSGHCLARIPQTLLWQGAHNQCVSRGGYLAVPDSAAENTLIRSITNSAQSMWIGINDINVEAGTVAANFQKVTGGTIGGGFHNFGAGLPNPNGDEDCGQIPANASFWNDLTCTFSTPQFVCEFEPNPCGDGVLQTANGEQCDDGNNVTGDGCTELCANEIDCNDFSLTNTHARVIDPETGNCFIGSSNVTNWRAANLNCINAGGYLAVIDDADENVLARSAAPSNVAAWIGLNDILIEANNVGIDFKTVQGDFTTFSGFRNGEPNSTGDEDCVHIEANGTGWNDESCNNTAFFICEFELASCGDGIPQPSRGEQCDDRNNINGDGCDDACQFEAGCGPNETEIFISADFGVTIPDNSGTQSVINVQTAGAIKKVRVGILQITHPFAEDIDIFITSPQGTQRELSTDNGADEDNYIGTLFSDREPNRIGVQTHLPPFSGKFAPEQSLAISGDLLNQNAQGNWTLSVSDDKAGDTGTFDGWTLMLCVDPTNAVCGNGSITGAEECDGGNTNNNDGCSNVCKIERCGDGIRQTNEACDDGNNIDNDGCDADCSLPCGGSLATRAIEDPDTGSCYFIVQQNLAWAAAETTCEEQGGHLVVTEGVREEALVQHLLIFGTRFWIGFNDLLVEATSDPSLFHRVTGGTIDDGFSHFALFQPDNSNNNEDCVQYFENTSWNDAPCTSPNNFICEIAPDPCGDGVLQSNFSEECDDGNISDGDGCSAACTVEPGFTCTSNSPAIGTPSSCQ
jgi:cysteine-rich repeat protein